MTANLGDGAMAEMPYSTTSGSGVSEDFLETEQMRQRSGDGGEGFQSPDEYEFRNGDREGGHGLDEAGEWRRRNGEINGGGMRGSGGVHGGEEESEEGEEVLPGYEEEERDYYAILNVPKDV